MSECVASMFGSRLGSL
jgi:hypothetical protein